MGIDSAGHLQIISDDSEWDRLVSNSLESNPFLMSSFLRSIGQENSRSVLIVNEEPVIGTCLLAPIESEPESTHAFCIYQGAFFPFIKQSSYSDENERLRSLQMLIHSIDSQGDPRHLSFHPHIKDLRAIDWFYYETDQAQLVPNIKSRYTGTIQIEKFASFEDYLTTIRKERLREYRRSLEGTQKVVLNSSDIENFMKIYVATFERQGISISSTKLDRVIRIISGGLQNESGQLNMLYSANDEPISGTFILSDKNMDVYLFGANDIHYHASYGSTRLLLESIKESFHKTKKIFDFCGMNSPSRGEFKSSFNARVEPYFELNLEVRKDN